MMKNKGIYTIAALFLLLSAACKSSSEAFTEAEMEDLKQLVEARNLEIESEWTWPLAKNSMNQIANAGLLPPGSTAGRINLVGSPNYLRIKGDSVSAYLPYYGERHIAGNYNNNNVGIQFEGIPEDFEVAKHEKKQAYKIRFGISDNAEAYLVNVTLFPNLKSEIVVNSNQRFSITYYGEAGKINEE